MSRAATPIYLTPQVGSTGNTVLVVSSTPSPFPDRTVTMTCGEFRTFRLFMLHVLGLDSKNHLNIRKFSGDHNVSFEILSFLYGGIANLMVPQLCSSHQQLRMLASLLDVAAPVRDYHKRPAVCFFDISADYKVSQLANAALNADLKTVQRIIAKTSLKDLSVLLSRKAPAIIAHLGIERTGTPLQMALYSQDEVMVKMLKSHMDPAVFQHQWMEVFGSDYKAFLERQQNEARTLCCELQKAFENATALAVTNALWCVPDTTSALQIALNRFQTELKFYVRVNLVQNPFILQTLVDMCCQSRWNADRICLLSQRVIGFAEKFSSAVWLQHLAQGVFYVGYHRHEPFSRSFLLRDSNLDIRELHLNGVNEGLCFIDMFGGSYSFDQVQPLINMLPIMSRVVMGSDFFSDVKQLCQTKTETLLQILQPHDNKRCCAM